MPEILDWQRTPDARQAIRNAVETLSRGGLVAFPTETVYGIAASASVPRAVERLAMCKGRPDNKPMTLAITGADDALNWVPEMSPLGRRLARRCWPGPVTLVYKQGGHAGLAADLSDSVRQRVCPTGSLGLRAPAHEAILHVLHSLDGPLVLTSANRSGQPDATTAAEVADSVGPQLDLLIDDGPSPCGQASTVVEVNGASWKILREGVVPAHSFERLSACMIVFICTGNTCRSPLAEAFCKKALATHFGCTQQELTQRGFIVLSAGLAAMMGCGAAVDSVEIGRQLDVDLTAHRSQPLNAQMLTEADYLVTMTQSHLLTLLDQFPELNERVKLLGAEGVDIPDPLGSGPEQYRACAEQIQRGLERFLPEVLRS